MVNWHRVTRREIAATLLCVSRNYPTCCFSWQMSVNEKKKSGTAKLTASGGVVILLCNKFSLCDYLLLIDEMAKNSNIENSLVLEISWCRMFSDLRTSVTCTPTHLRRFQVSQKKSNICTAPINPLAKEKAYKNRRHLLRLIVLTNVGKMLKINAWIE